MTTTVPGALPAAVDNASGHLFARQRADGSWRDALPSAAVSTATAIVALHAASRYVADPPGSLALVASGAAWLRDTQDAAGGWGDAVGAPATLNATAIATAALRIVAPEESADTIARGRAWIDGHGGMAAVADRRRCTLSVIAVNYFAQTGDYPADRLSRLPFELIWLPRPLRQKLSFTVPGLMSFGLMHAHTRKAGPVRRLVNRVSQGPALRYLDELRRYEQTTGQSRSAPVGGYQESPLMAGVVCYGLARAGLAGHGPARAIVSQVVRFLHATVRDDGAWPVNRDLEFSASMFVTHGLADAGHAGDERLAGTRAWIERCQRRTAFPATGAPAGGWGWSLPAGWPNTDDTSNALLSLAALGGRPDPDPYAHRGVAWLRRMQNRDGSWGCFARNAPNSLDAPCAVFTAHAVLALHEAGGLGPDDRPVARALAWFQRNQRPDGSMPALWYREHTSGTARVLHALGRLGLAETSTAHRCREWLLAHQNADGGWGDGAGAESTPEETAWAVLGLVDAGLAGHAATAGGVDWLVTNQLPDGGWRPTLLGVYFHDLMYHDDLICAGYALQALGRYRAANGGGR